MNRREKLTKLAGFTTTAKEITRRIITDKKILSRPNGVATLGDNRCGIWCHPQESKKQ